MFALIGFQVFHLHIILGLQNLLCVWIHASGFHNSFNRHYLCDNRLYLLPIKCGGLSVAVDFVFCCRFNVWLRVLVLFLLFSLQNQVSDLFFILNYMFFSGISTSSKSIVCLCK